MKKCPYCAEEIQDEAIKCRYCHEFLEKEIESNPIEDKWRCPICDREVLLSKDYCVCGHYKYSKNEEETLKDKSKNKKVDIWFYYKSVVYTSFAMPFWLIVGWFLVEISEAVLLEEGGQITGAYQSLHGMLLGFFLWYSSYRTKSDFVLFSIVYPGVAFMMLFSFFFLLDINSNPTVYYSFWILPTLMITYGLFQKSNKKMGIFVSIGLIMLIIIYVL